MTYPDYLEQIIAEYHRKRAAGLLSPTLLNPTPAKLKKESRAVFRDRFDRKDFRNLAHFFDVSKEDELDRAIRLFPTDKFKPLSNYLNGGPKESDDKNIELLGWLIDFRPRPVDVWRLSLGSVTLADKGEDVVGGDALRGDEDIGIRDKGNRDRPTIDPILKTSKPDVIEKAPAPYVRARRRTILTSVFGMMAVASGGLYITSHTSEHAQCMVWTDDRYKAVVCDSVPSGVLALGYDEKLLRDMRRVTQIDTITEKQCGIFGYRKRGKDSLDVYTTVGRDPSEPTKQLKILTLYILEHYIQRKYPTTKVVSP